MLAYRGGVRGQFDGEEQPLCSIIDLPGRRFILDQVIALLEARVSQDRLFSVLACEVISRSELVGLFERRTDVDLNDMPRLVRETFSELRQQTRLLENGICTLYAMRRELEGAEDLLLHEGRDSQGYESKVDGGLKAIYK